MSRDIELRRKQILNHLELILPKPMPKSPPMNTGTPSRVLFFSSNKATVVNNEPIPSQTDSIVPNTHELEFADLMFGDVVPDRNKTGSNASQESEPKQDYEFKPGLFAIITEIQTKINNQATIIQISNSEKVVINFSAELEELKKLLKKVILPKELNDADIKDFVTDCKSLMNELVEYETELKIDIIDKRKQAKSVPIVTPAPQVEAEPRTRIGSTNSDKCRTCTIS